MRSSFVTKLYNKWDKCTRAILSNPTVIKGLFPAQDSKEILVGQVIETYLMDAIGC